MKTSVEGQIAIVRHEGVVPAPYLDVAGVWTFGVGHAETAGTPPRPSTMTRGMPADMDAAIRQAFALFRDRLAPYEDAVTRAVPGITRQHEFDALVSLCFNIGPAAFARSSVVRHLKAGRRDRAVDAFGAWNKARVDGKLQAVPGLTARRAEERKLFEAGIYPPGGVPVWGVTSANRPDMRRPIRTLTASQVAALLRTAPPAPAQRQQDAPTGQTRPEAPAPRSGPVAAILAYLARIFGGNT